ncbi:MAG TPA: BTAD domain-containing putative transcriptional regulator [Solirubrobacteraceae bacterium]
MLGPLLVRDAGGPVTLASGKQRALLATLLLETSSGLVSSERLIDELWGEDPPATAGKALQVHVSQLRRALGSEQPIVTRPTGYAIQIDRDALDVQRFEALLARARGLRADGDPSHALDALRQAIGLWRGPALADVTLLGPGATEADRLDGLRAVANEERIELELEQDDPAALVPELEALIGSDPYRERMHALLMLALYRAGRQADALEAFRHVRTLLIENLGIEPGPDLVRLEAAILTQDPSLELAASAAPPLARGDAGVPAAARIPHVDSSILGRDAELRAALALIERPDVRLVTLTGAGGMGKTRLALELAMRLGGASRLVELAAIDESDQILPAIGAALGAEDATEEAVAAALDGDPVVLFLDNFEQVLAGAPAVASLLRAVGSLTVVVTSRAPLHIAGEHELPLPPLAPDPAVELFVRRAGDQDPGFAPSAEELNSIAAICGRLDGLPLAIELAAARTRVLDPAQILERIGGRLDLLTAGRRDAPERHRTLRATIAWSYELLDADEQRLFARLAVFHSGWSLEAAEAVDDGPVLDTLSALVDHSLVIRDGARFRMLETVREYAVERLASSPDPAAVGRRQALWCVELAEAAEPELEGPQQAAWLERLDAEQANLRAASSWALANGEPEIALALGGALWRLWLTRGTGVTVQRELTEALASGRGEPGIRARALNAVGILAGAADDFPAAQSAFEEAIALAKSVGDRKQLARAVGNLGLVVSFLQQFDAALALYAEASDMWQELGDVKGESVILQNMAIVHARLGQFDQAIPILEQGVALARRTGDRMHVASTLIALGRILLSHRPEDPGSTAMLREALELSVALGERVQTTECLEAVAELAARTGDAVTGAALVGAADAERERAGARRKPDEFPFYDTTVEKLERALGHDVYARERERGRSASLEAAVAVALAATVPGGSQPRSGRARSG